MTAEYEPPGPWCHATWFGPAATSPITFNSIKLSTMGWLLQLGPEQLVKTFHAGKAFHSYQVPVTESWGGEVAKRLSCKSGLPICLCCEFTRWPQASHFLLCNLHVQRHYAMQETLLSSDCRQQLLP